MKRAKNKNAFMNAGFVILLLILMFSLVSAQYGYSYVNLRQGAEDIIQWVIDIFGPFLQVLFGGIYGSSYLLFEKFALFILLIAIVYIAVGRVPVFAEKKGVLWIISIVVPLLAIRFIDITWLDTILLQYHVLGIALTAILPFAIYLFFLHNVFPEMSVPRKIGWIFFIVIYFGLWSTAESEIYGQVYLWTMIISLLFLLLDGTIHKWYMKQKFIESGARGKWQYIAELKSDIREIEQAMRNNDIPQNVGKKMIKEKQNLINYWMKQ